MPAQTLNVEYLKKIPPKRGRKPKCKCGNFVTHLGMVESTGHDGYSVVLVSLMSGCQLCVARWVSISPLKNRANKKVSKPIVLRFKP